MTQKRVAFAIALASCLVASFALSNNAFACSTTPCGQEPHHYPPMLGDTNPYKFSGGVQVNSKTYDVNGKTVFVNQTLSVGQQATLLLNVFDVRQMTEVKHIGIYIAKAGQSVPTSSMPYIEWDSSTGVNRNTGSGTFAGMTGGLSIQDTNHGQARFSFVPMKSFGDASIIVRMWDVRGVSADHVLTGIHIGSSSTVNISDENPCDKIVKKKGWKPTPECLAYELA